ncbi:ATPase [Marinomonas sp. UCMA 3892]|uniref:AAA family ATPase n=1 Tax=Marinomonas sp. UCMA 3892 TaxID=1972585 RepID=UPI00146D412D|nr:AAA family ATPase [Marinomonas sp. UCMA 3892]NLU99005.1 ATPase [Marinomonas sp. UCMA 3892]
MPTVPYKNEIPKKYNPQNTSTAVLKKTFAIRLKEFKRLWKEISQSDMTSPEQHYIIQGVRGAGKTTLLTRLSIEVEESDALSAWLIPIQLKEEEYGISSLFSFWLRIAEDLEEHPLYGTNFKGLAEAIEDIEPEDGEDAKEAFKLLNNALNKHQQKIIIFIDNIAELFDHFSKVDLAILREVLSQNANLRIIGGSAVSLENFYDHKHPFYQFFNVITLGKLTKDETLDLLLALGEAAGEDAAQQIKLAIEQQPEKIESIRRLTGGVPRTMALLFDILAEGPHGTTFGYLDDTLDMASPIYKHRMDDLSKQQKPIVHAIAKHWDAISVKEIAQKTRIDSKTISAQLSQLQKQWIVEKIHTDNKNHLYRIQERFFNIWYLMRYGRRRDKNKLLWLTRFIEMWCTQEDLTHRVTQYSSGLSNDAYLPGTLAYTSALLGCKNISVNEKEQIYQHAHDFFKQQSDTSYLSLLPEIEGNEYAKEALTYINNNEFELSIKFLKIAAEKGFFPSYHIMANLYHFELNNFQLAEKNYLKAIEHKLNDMLFYLQLGVLYEDGMKNYHKAEQAYIKAIEHGNHSAYILLGNIYEKHLNNFPKAKQSYIKAVEYEYYYGYIFLGNLYAKKFENINKAEQFFFEAIKHEKTDAYTQLAWLYFSRKLIDKKIQALSYAQQGASHKEGIFNSYTLASIALWNNEFNIAITAMEKIFISDTWLQDLEENSQAIIDLLMLFLAKKQTHLLNKWFKEYNLTEQFKPLYYVLMFLMKDEYPNEYLRMGSELEETVTEMLARIDELAVKYQ